MLLDYNTALYNLKRNRPGERGPEVRLVDLTELVFGVKENKVERWLPKGTKALKIHLGIDNQSGAVIWPDIDLGKLSVIFAEPGSKSLNALVIPGKGVGDMYKFLAEYGIIVERTEKARTKAFKRLKRSLTVGTIASTTNFSMKIVQDPALAPESLTDGMAFVKLSKIRKMLPNENLEDGDCFTYSYAGPEGTSKGTLVARRHLTEDLIIPGLHNIKTEVKFFGCEALNNKGQRVLAIEQVLSNRVPCTDLQTMINMGSEELFSIAIQEHITELERIAAEPGYAQYYFDWVFPRKDWFQFVVDKAVEKGLDLPEVPPILHQARKDGLPVMMTPQLHKELFNFARKSFDVRDLKARLPKNKASAGYIIPDLSQFDENGEFHQNGMGLEENQISFPGDLEVGPTICYRQPNSWGEAVPAINVKAPVKSRSGVQLNIHNAAEWLKIWGGGDYDDALNGIYDESAFRAYWNSERERTEAGIGRVQLEKYIDLAVQDSSNYELNFTDQVACASRRMELSLGQIVNFAMNIVLTARTEPSQIAWYKKIETCKNIQQLKAVWDEYHNSELPPMYADIFCPKKIDEYDPYARVPAVEWEEFVDNYGNVKRQPKLYMEHRRVKTKLGDFIANVSSYMNDLADLDNASNILADSTYIQSEEFMSFLNEYCRYNSKEEMDIEARCRASDLVNMWYWILGYNVKENSVNKSLLKHVNMNMVDESKGANLATQIMEWQKMCGIVFNTKYVGDHDVLSLKTTAHLAWLWLRERLRFDPKTNGKSVMYGRDTMLWKPCRNKDYSIQNGFDLNECWRQILKDFNEVLKERQRKAVQHPVAIGS